jgi:hypothetical protein
MIGHVVTAGFALLVQYSPQYLPQPPVYVPPPVYNPPPVYQGVPNMAGTVPLQPRPYSPGPSAGCYYKAQGC